MMQWYSFINKPRTSSQYVCVGSLVVLSPSHTGLTTRLRPRYDRIFSESRANR